MGAKVETSSKDVASTRRMDLISIRTVDEWKIDLYFLFRCQVSDFGRFSEAVMSLDLDLCKTVSVLENVQQQQNVIETRQQEIDMSLDQIEVSVINAYAHYS